MRLGEFIRSHLEPILVEWETVARTMIPPAETMSAAALRDHAERILTAIASDLETSPDQAGRAPKAPGPGAAAAEPSAASEHGRLRHRAGFDLVQLAAEYRALRTSVLRLWHQAGGSTRTDASDATTRFNDGIDQALADSIASYSHEVARSRDMFLAVLGHDLRNPLGSLDGCLHLIGTESLPAERRQRALDIARRSVSSIEEMITNLLEYTRTRLGRGIEVEPAPGDLGRLCREAVEEISAAYPGLSIAASLSGDLHATFDAPRVRQALINLLGNAVQHGGSGSPVALAARGLDDRVELEVRNDGPPIPAELMQVIFDPLVQIPTAASEPHERPATNLGLGLYIAREIVGAHGGRIAVASSAGQGTVFRITLPRR